MVKFRNIAFGHSVNNWWDNKQNQIAFSRGNKAFIAINNDLYEMNVELETGLPSGSYCDIISGGKKDGICIGNTINVDKNGKIKAKISNNALDPIIAVHVDSKL